MQKYRKRRSKAQHTARVRNAVGGLLSQLDTVGRVQKLWHLYVSASRHSWHHACPFVHPSLLVHLGCEQSSAILTLAHSKALLLAFMTPDNFASIQF